MFYFVKIICLIIKQYNLIYDIKAVERIEDVLLNAYKDIGIILNTGKIKYMEAGRHWRLVGNSHITISRKSDGE